VTSVDATILLLSYEDGPHNAEAMFIDPREEELYVIVKELTAPSSAVYAPARRGAPGEADGRFEAPDGLSASRRYLRSPSRSIPTSTARIQSSSQSIRSSANEATVWIPQ